MWTVFWQTILLAALGTFIMRLGGRKSISQMTIPQITILLALGTVLGGEVSGQGMSKTILALITFVGFLIAVEWITLRWNRAETALKGESIPVISNGKLLVDNLKTLRISVDDLEKRLRMAGISRLEDVKTGTIEDNGELGYELMPHARPVTMGDLEKILKENFPQVSFPTPNNKDTIFEEVTTGSNTQDIPNQLQ